MPPPKGKNWLPTLARVIFFWVCCVVFMAIASGVAKSSQSGWPQVLPIAGATIGVLLLTLMFVRWERLSMSAVGVVPGPRTISHVLVGLLAGSVMALLQPLLAIATGHLHLMRNPAADSTVIILNLFLYITVACREEIAFRAYPLRSLNYRAGPWIAQTIVAVLFIIEHKIGGMSWPQAIIGPGIGAVLFGFAALRTNGIALPIGLHIAWNFGQWVFGLKNNNGLYHAIVDRGYENRADQLGWVSYIVVVTLAIAILYYRKKAIRGANENER